MLYFIYDEGNVYERSEKTADEVKKITIKDVAKEAGVSVATVSRALNGLGGIGKETRDHVLEICERMAYVPSTLASGLTIVIQERWGLWCRILPVRFMHS